MEIVIPNIGLDLQLITPALFTMTVMIAIVTTLITVPLLGWLQPSHFSTSSLTVRWETSSPRGSLPDANPRD